MPPATFSTKAMSAPAITMIATLSTTRFAPGRQSVNAYATITSISRMQSSTG